MFPEAKGRRRALRILGLASLATAAVVAIALNTRVSPGAVYTGHLLNTGAGQSGTGSASGEAITFKVAQNGRSVGSFRVPPGLFCSPASLGTAPVPISKGTFTARLPIVAGGQTVGTLTVTGRFGVLGREIGELTVSLPARPGCDLSARYSAKT
jgi:hypothetical protein